MYYFDEMCVTYSGSKEEISLFCQRLILRKWLDALMISFSCLKMCLCPKVDEEVDATLTTLRMKLLVQLEQDQKEVNALISQIQAITAGKAKPLKQAKMRKHNVNAPPPSKKQNGKHRRK